MKIAVLCGGQSPEREVSLSSGDRVAKALAERGHEVTLGEPPISELYPEMCKVFGGVDAIFLALHGGAGEDGRLQLAFEKKCIRHYTGSPPFPSALAMRKDLAKRCVSAVGVPIAGGCVIEEGGSVPSRFCSPLVVKPLSGGSSVGLVFLHTDDEVTAFRASETVVCERYLGGREYSVGILDGKALPPIEIRPHGGVYDYHHKYTEGETEEICPAPLPVRQTELLKRQAQKCFFALRLRDFARIDFRENERGEFCFLEANTLPGLAATSLLPLAARKAGIPFSELCERLAILAAARKP